MSLIEVAYDKSSSTWLNWNMIIFEGGFRKQDIVRIPDAGQPDHFKSDEIGPKVSENKIKFDPPLDAPGSKISSEFRTSLVQQTRDCKIIFF